MRDLPGRSTVSRDWFGLADFRPGPKFLRDGGALFLLESAGSTNDFLRGQGEAAPGRLCTWDGWGWSAAAPAQLAPVHAPRPGTVVVARSQTDGHGRQGRSWLDCGGLNLSVVVPPHRAALERGFSVWLGLVTALVLREEFQLDVRLKWPNDLMMNGRKLGGILLQRSGPPEAPLVVAGLGLNLATEKDAFPASLQGQATSVWAESGQKLRPGHVAGQVLERVEAELDRFEAGGWAAYRPALDLLDCLLGHSVRLVSGGVEHTGRAAGFDDGGALILTDASGADRRTFHAGDVHLLPSADIPENGETPNGES